MAFDPVSAIFNVGEKLIDRLWPDPQKKAEATLELLKLQQSGELQQMMAQVEVNKAEAANPSVLTSGWRPGCGWVCVTALGYQMVVRPIGTWIAALAGHPIAMPELDISSLMTVLLGMLGLGAYRTYEKVNDSAGNH